MLPKEPPASLPVIVPVTGSTEAISGFDDVQVISEVSPVDGLTFVIAS